MFRSKAVRLSSVYRRQFSSSPCLMAKNREKLYGNEPGHGVKNEVRKEKWIWRKQRPNRFAEAAAYRTSQNLPPDPLKHFDLFTTPDWSFVESASDNTNLRRRPGLLTENQTYTKEKMADLCLQTKRAMSFVHALDEEQNCNSWK